MGGRRTSEKSGWGPIDTSPSSSSANGCTKVGWEERREEGGRTTCVKIDFRSCYSIPPFLFLNLRNSQTFRLEKGGDHHYVSNRRLPIFFSRKEKKVNLLSLFPPGAIPEILPNVTGRSVFSSCDRRRRRDKLIRNSPPPPD